MKITRYFCILTLFSWHSLITVLRGKKKSISQKYNLLKVVIFIHKYNFVLHYGNDMHYHGTLMCLRKVIIPSTVRPTSACWDEIYQLNCFDGYFVADGHVFWVLTALKSLSITSFSQRFICLCFYAVHARLHKHICAFASYFSKTLLIKGRVK